MRGQVPLGQCSRQPHQGEDGRGRTVVRRGWEPLADIAEGSVIVCHNAMFDTNVLCSCLAHYGLKMPECRYLCTVKVSKRVWPELENHKLDTVSAALHIDLNHHEAGSDARAAGLILQAALRRTGSADADALAEKSACGSAGFPRWGKRRAASLGTPNPGSTDGQHVRVIR